MPAEGKLWIAGNDDATGIGALDVATGLITEEAQFAVHSVLFEDTFLAVEEREGWIRTIRQNPKILEGHLKVTAAGEILVHRAVQGSQSTKNFKIRHFRYSKNSHGHQSVAAVHLPLPRPNEVEVAVEAFGLTDLEDETPHRLRQNFDGKKVLLVSPTPKGIAVYNLPSSLILPMQKALVQDYNVPKRGPSTKVFPGPLWSRVLA